MSEAEREAFDAEVERQIARHGGLHASLIRDSLRWLAERSAWNKLSEVGKDVYINALVPRQALEIQSSEVPVRAGVPEWQSDF